MPFIETARQAEINAAKRMREFGFHDAQPTPVGPDGGVDVRSSRAIAEVKWRSAQAGRPEVQKLYGARGTKHHLQMFFFAAGGFSKGAVQYADEADVKLFTYDPNGVLSPVNRAATSFVQRLAREDADKRRIAEQKRSEGEHVRVQGERAPREHLAPASLNPAPPTPALRVDDFAAARAQIEAEFIAQVKRGATRHKEEESLRQRDARNQAMIIARQRRDYEIRSRGKIPTSAPVVVLLWLLIFALGFAVFIFLVSIVVGWFQGGPVAEKVMVSAILLVFACPFVLGLRAGIRSLWKREIP